MTQDVSCVWCPKDGGFCAPPTGVDGCPGAQPGCVLTADTVEAILEDEQAFLDIDALFLIFGEDNTTDFRTSADYDVSFEPSNSNCDVVLDTSGSVDQAVLTPAPNWSGLCDIIISIINNDGIAGGTKALTSRWQVTVNPVNDEPVILDEAGGALEGLGSMKEDTDLMIDSCLVFSDADGDTMTITFSGATGSLDVAATDCDCGGTATCMITVSPEPNVFGEGELTITADDGNGGTVTTESIFYSIESVNDPPVLVGTLGNETLPENDRTEYTIDLSGVFEDPEGEELFYDVSANLGNLVDSFSIDGSSVFLQLNPALNGAETVVVTATDPEGGSANTSFVFTITSVNDEIQVIADPPTEYTGDAGTNTTFNLSDYYADEESSFAAGTLKCTASSATSSQVGASVSGSTLTIRLLQATTSAVTVSVSCKDNNAIGDFNEATFDLSVTSNFVNTAPRVKKAFPDAKGTISSVVRTYTLSEYFTDDDAGQTSTLSYSAPSPAPTQITTSIINGVLTVSFTSTATGTYTVTVTATDIFNAVVSSTLTAIVYAAPACLDIPQNWDPVAPLVVDLDTICTGSEARTYALSPIPGQALTTVTTTLSGSTLTISSTSPCVKGTYTTTVRATDASAAFDDILVSLSVEPASNNSVRSTKASFTFEIVQVAGQGSASNDGEFLHDGSTTLTLPLAPYFVQCGSTGALVYTITSQQYTPLQATNAPGTLIASIVGSDLIIEATNLGTLVRTWKEEIGLEVEDQFTRQKVTVAITINKTRTG